ncbi:MAG: hypothetical protein U9N34_04015 [Candidatus Cloacimonadota bacterium]|nr:hypothetical protein [Candidatus Cloacimonadota bacterium]
MSKRVTTGITEYNEIKINIRLDRIYDDSIDLESINDDFIIQKSEHYGFKKDKREYYEARVISTNPDKILVSYFPKAYLSYRSYHDKIICNEYGTISKIEKWENNSSTALKIDDLQNLTKAIFEVTYLEEKNKKVII